MFCFTDYSMDPLLQRRFFFRPAFDIYGDHGLRFLSNSSSHTASVSTGGCAGFYTYGPPGAALKANIIAQWRRHFVIEENLLEIEVFFYFSNLAGSRHEYVLC